MPIESESHFILNQIKFILKIPFTLILILLKKESIKTLEEPLKELIAFILEPKITLVLIIINISVFIYQIFWMPQEVFDSLVFRPEQLTNLNFIPMLASWFLHGSLTHLLGNMTFLFIMGRVVEKRFGIKMVLIYFGAGIISSLLSALFGQGGIGASGCISGLISTAILTQPFYLTYLIFGIPIPIMVLGWLAMLNDVTGILYQVDDNVGHFAHLGGYISIAFLMFLLEKNEREELKHGLLINVISIVIVVVGYFIFMK